MSVTLDVSDDFARRLENQPQAAEPELHLMTFDVGSALHGQPQHRRCARK